MSDIRHYEELTEREHEILELIAAGLSNKAIAARLFLSPNTVAWYIQQIFSKLYVNRRTKAVAIARELGILDTTHQTGQHIKHIKKLPVQTTAFIGREAEIDDLNTLWHKTNCRLLSLVGQGGIGKTRLSIALATQLSTQETASVIFTALQPLKSVDMLVPAIARATGLTLKAGEAHPLQQLLDFLADKSIILILDNFETVLDGRDIIYNMLRSCPGVRFIITSREALNLQEEYLYELEGLQYPAQDQNGDPQSYDAIALFTQKARHLLHDFSLDDNLEHVIRICNLVDGIPLAIELAASWVKAYSCTEIVAELEQGLEILTTPFHNIPERHRSIYAVFDASWQRLSAKNQEVFRRLSIFRGGFTRQAAIEVTGATRMSLHTLVTKSFLHHDPHTDRYSIHQLLRQFGEHQLANHDQEKCQSQNLHSQYYADMLDQYREATFGNELCDVMNTLDLEIDNVRLAWDWTLDRLNTHRIQQMAQTFWVYLVFHSQFLEGARLFDKALETANNIQDEVQRVTILAELENLSGMFYIRLGQSNQAQKHFMASDHLYQSYEIPLPAGWVTDPTIGLSIVQDIQGNYEAAISLARQAIESAETHQQGLNLILAHYVATGALYHLGQYQEAQYHAQTAYDLTIELGEQWVRAEILLDLGRIARELNQYNTARHYFETSQAIRERFGDSQGVAAALSHLGRLAMSQGDYVQAEQFYRRSYQLYKEVGDRGGEGYGLAGLGEVASYSGDYAQALEFFKQALVIAEKSGYAPLQFSILQGLSTLLIQTGYVKIAIQLLSLILSHESSDHDAKVHAELALQTIPLCNSHQNSTTTDQSALQLESQLDTIAIIQQFSESI